MLAFPTRASASIVTPSYSMLTVGSLTPAWASFPAALHIVIGLSNVTGLETYTNSSIKCFELIQFTSLAIFPATTAIFTIFDIIWLLHNLVEASFDLFRYQLLSDKLKPWEHARTHLSKFLYPHSCHASVSAAIWNQCMNARKRTTFSSPSHNI